MTEPLPAPRNLRGALAMLAAVTCFSMMDAQLKMLAAHYPPMQVAALRGLAALPLVLAYVLWRGEWRKLLRVRWGLHLLRGVLVVAMLALFTGSLRTLGLAEAYALFFIAPLLITALSAPVLGERVRPAHWLAIGAGLAGVLVALRPDQRAMLSMGGLAVLAAASFYAVSAVAGRVLTRTDSSAAIVFWTTTMLALGAGALALPGWTSVAQAHWPLVAGLALTGFLGQTAITEAFRHGQASVVAPLEYTALAWGVGLDWLLWQALPDGATLLGGAIIIASGIALVRSERRRTALR
ncbi:MAG: DMT family transporter [Burkholderiaceae bacterium]|nr:DMT family transporter [Burkholderiaceae bacterium]